MDREQIIQVSDKIQEWIKEVDKSIEKIRKIQSEVETELESQLTSEPPALRHGAGGVNRCGRPFVAVKCNSGAHDNRFGVMPIFDNGGSDREEYAIANPDEYTILIPNIFDELSAMSKENDSHSPA